MMKTPNEIKAGLECIGSSPEKCSYCAYDAEDCAYHVGRDALAYIQQLEQELAAVKRERDAAIFALHGNCDECRWQETAKCASCIYDINAWNTHDDCWEYGGVGRCLNMNT